jgi:hypothetical protein
MGLSLEGVKVLKGAEQTAQKDEDIRAEHELMETREEIEQNMQIMEIQLQEESEAIE